MLQVVVLVCNCIKYKREEMRLDGIVMGQMIIKKLLVVVVVVLYNVQHLLGAY